MSDAERIMAKLEGAAEKVVRRIQLTAWQTLTSATPVDTGHARSGWLPTTGSPADARLDAPKDRGDASSQAGARFAASATKAQQIAATYKLPQGKVFLTNPVPYIVYLNAGSSAQAPANFVDIAIAQAVKAGAKGPI